MSKTDVIEETESYRKVARSAPKVPKDCPECKAIMRRVFDGNAWVADECPLCNDGKRYPLRHLV